MRRSLGAGFTRRCVLIVPRSRERQINYHDTILWYCIRSEVKRRWGQIESRAVVSTYGDGTKKREADGWEI